MKSKLEKNLFFHSREKAEKRVGQATSKTRLKVYGIDTTAKSRDLMIDILKKDVVEHPEFFRIKKLYDQVRNLERTKNGKIEHSSHSHDDILFAYLMCRYAMWYHMDILGKYFLKVNIQRRNVSHMEIVGSNNERAVESRELLMQPIMQPIESPLSTMTATGGLKLAKRSNLISVINLNNDDGGR
jgi:hypothetical protein